MIDDADNMVQNHWEALEEAFDKARSEGRFEIGSMRDPLQRAFLCGARAAWDLNDPYRVVATALLKIPADEFFGPSELFEARKRLAEHQIEARYGDWKARLRNDLARRPKWPTDRLKSDVSHAFGSAVLEQALEELR